jgi:hypothetical protein
LIHNALPVKLYARSQEDLESGLPEWNKKKIVSLKVRNWRDKRYYSCISQCTNLEELIIYFRKRDYVYYQITEHIADFKNLRVLNLENINISERNVSFLRECKQIKYLRLANTNVLSISEIECCKKLERLILDPCRITDFSPLRDCPHLENLILGYECIDINNNEHGYADIATIGNAKSVVRLRITGARHFYPAPNHLSVLPNLEELEFVACYGISDISFLIGNFAKLKYIGIIDCSVSLSETHFLREACPGVEVHFSHWNSAMMR